MARDGKEHAWSELNGDNQSFKYSNLNLRSKVGGNQKQGFFVGASVFGIPSPLPGTYLSLL